MYRPLSSHLPALDGLRGVAALLVLAEHCANEGWLPQWLGSGLGQVGVEVFYVLSGFLMMHFAVDRDLNRVSLRRYAVARTARVLPLYVGALLITTLLYFPLGGVSFYGVDDPGDLVRSWLLFRGAGVLWSVPVELHFYLLFPLLWWAHRAGRFLPLSLALLAACALLAVLVPVPEPAGYLPFWLHLFVIGALLRWLIDDGRRNRLPVATGNAWIGPLAWGCFAALALLQPGWRGVPEQLVRIDPVAIVLIPVALWFSVAGLGPFKLFAAPLLRWYGAISYGVYLVHSPVISMIKYVEHDRVIGAWSSFLLVLAGSTLAAALSLRLFERPVQDWLRTRYISPSIAAQ